MYKLINNTIAIILSGLFLVSFTGVKFIAHHCFKCQDTDYSFFAVASDSSDCCSHHALHQVPQSNTCCTLSDSEGVSNYVIPEIPHCTSPTQRCCKKEVVYLKNDYEVLTDRQDKRLIPSIIGLLPVLTERSLAPESPTEIILFSKNDLQAPLRLSGKDFIIFTHHFKVS